MVHHFIELPRQAVRSAAIHQKVASTKKTSVP
jgi:hypothetical protein